MKIVSSWYIPWTARPADLSQAKDDYPDWGNLFFKHIADDKQESGDEESSLGLINPNWIPLITSLAS